MPALPSVNLGKTARISASEFEGPQLATDQKGGIFLSERSQILDVQQQAERAVPGGHP